MKRTRVALATVLAAMALSIGGCAYLSERTLPVQRVLETPNDAGAGKIRHVVYIVQENRSFDDLFQGYPHADTVSSGKNSKGETIQLRPVSLARHFK